MALTLQRCSDVIQQALKRPPSSANSAEFLVNEAGQVWVGAHGWLYLAERKTTLDLVAGTTVYRMAPGTKALLRVLAASTVAPIVELLPRASFEEAVRGSSFVYPVPYLGTTYEELDPSDQRRKLTLEIHPAPTTAQTLTIIYEAGWVPVETDTSVLDIPNALEAHFTSWLRAYARGLEKHPDATVEDMIARLQESPIFASATTLDGQHAPVLPPKRGPIGERFARGMGAPYRSLPVGRIDYEGTQPWTY